MIKNINLVLLFIVILSVCSEGNSTFHYEMVLVKPGTFIMGNNKGKEADKPEHKVVITKPYYIGKYEVTYELYDAFCKEEKISLVTDMGWGRKNYPVIVNSVTDTYKFCNWLSKKNGLIPCYTIIDADNIKWDKSANGYRLPTEAEWEFAAQGGNLSKGYKYSGSNDKEEVSWHRYNSGEKPHPVGLKKANELGIYDMSGNLWEICWDFFYIGYYKKSPLKDPVNEKRIYTIYRYTRRGGSYKNSVSGHEVRFRANMMSYSQEPVNGIRLVRNHE